MAYNETLTPTYTAGVGGGPVRQTHHNPSGVAHAVTGEGISSAAATVTLEGSNNGLTWTTIGTATPGAGGFFRITGTSSLRNLRLTASAATTITNGLISVHD